ncbi:MAG: glycosyltransferase family 39 protein [Leptolyngbyaceae bacterium]|nr:glycosyltransferase family 39 protein [Leptolyngbyaceae bacterium]
MKSLNSDTQWTLVLLVGALGLWCIALGDLPLRDWDEGTYASVAREIYRSGNWLHPSLYGQPFLFKPPLVEWLIALSYRVGGISEFTTRLLPSLLTALAVPLMYGVGREIFQQRLPALFSALVYLTLLPVVRHGRLAMHDGIAVSAFLLLFLGLLKSRQHKIWAIAAGIALGIIGFSKGILMLLLGGIVLLFLIADGQIQWLTNPYFWVGMFLGNVPLLAWYAAQGQHYGADFWKIHLLNQSFDRVWQPVENNAGPPWYYLLELLKYSWPWLIFWPGGLVLAWRQRYWSWGRLVLIGTVIFLGTISVMKTKLPWYVMPLYPFMAFAVGAQLTELWQTRKSYAWSWMGWLGFLAIASLSAPVYIGWTESKPLLILIGLVLGLTFGLAAWLLYQRNHQFIPVLFSGFYLSLGLLMTSNFWIWELNEAFPVKPVAALILENVSPEAKVYTSFAYNRPSLDFYSDRSIHPIGNQDLQQLWSTKPYLLLDDKALAAAKLPKMKKLGIAAGFTLVGSQ